MVCDEKVEAVYQRVYAAVQELRLELASLRGSQANAKTANIGFINPDVLDMLEGRVAELTVMEKNRSINLTTVSKVKQTVSAVESLASLLTTPHVKRVQ